MVSLFEKALTHVIYVQIKSDHLWNKIVIMARATCTSTSEDDKKIVRSAKSKKKGGDEDSTGKRIAKWVIMIVHKKYTDIQILVGRFCH